ncbi:hypothetical protein TRFO_03480 [Tritrichomonas foetus]|uniref:Uncharacterized protein n=1 Tax=Tritrichomonas foetus TaxID=1144522 RepID=A0A1J4KPM4_9EUKA|nr:hypothetical protein TRFO_03480 [Tritrichomonas foetus]|eukprot:OHT13058.1 hypothetical protein TRFO_03480 [Tritrichomonas foetus]
MSSTIKTSFSSNSSKKSQHSVCSVRSFSGVAEEEEEIKMPIHSDSESLSQIIHESKNRNKLQMESVQLKQQIIDNKQKFETERNEFIQNELKLREENQRLINMLQRIAKASGTSISDPEFENIITNKIKNSGHTDNFDFNLESMNLKDQRINELENAIKESQKLIQSMENEIDQKIQEKNEIQAFADDQQRTIDDLSSLVRQFMVACEITDSPENAIKNIQEMKRKFKRMESLSETTKIDEMLRQFEERRANEYGRLFQQVEEQGNLIHNAIESLQANMGNDDDTSHHSLEVYQTLQQTNKMLAERMNQLRGGRKSDLSNSRSNNGSYSRSDSSSKADLIDTNYESYDRRGLGPSIWIAKTREMLSLERQLMKTNQRLENANRNCQCLANENMYFRSMAAQNPKIAQHPIPATLI